MLNKYHIKFGRIDRMTFGFLLAAVSGAIGAIVQWRVYETSPCGYMASSCPEVSPINIWWQIPNVSLGALSELFCNVTAYEMAYARSPPNMKSLVMAFFLFTTALSSALMELLIPVVDDPHLIVSLPDFQFLSYRFLAPYSFFTPSPLRPFSSSPTSFFD